MTFKQKKRIIDDFLADPIIKKCAEDQCGLPIKVKVDWDKDVLSIRGSISGREWKISEVIKDLTRTTH